MVAGQPGVLPDCYEEFVAAAAAGEEGAGVAPAGEAPEGVAPGELVRDWGTEELKVYQYHQVTDIII